MERKNVYICMLAALLSCSDSVKVSRTLDAMPAIFPDYNGVVIPPNMAPTTSICFNSFLASEYVISSNFSRENPSTLVIIIDTFRPLFNNQ
mgnify:CR=1 FL=1